MKAPYLVVVFHAAGVAIGAGASTGARPVQGTFGGALELNGVPAGVLQASQDPAALGLGPHAALRFLAGPLVDEVPMMASRLTAAAFTGVARLRGSRRGAAEGEPQRRKDERAVKRFLTDYVQRILDLTVTILVWLLVTILVGIYYERVKEYPCQTAADGQLSPVEELTGDWKYNFWGCCSTPLLCVFSWCCSAVRWADTARMAGFLGFWVALLAFFCALLLSNALFFFGTIPLACIGMHYRQKLRASFKIEHGTCWTVTGDLLAYAFCPCLAITQEARTLEEAYRVGHPAVSQARSKLIKDFQREKALFSSNYAN